jgi:hypothetical protein
MKLEIHFPWETTEKGQGFFVPCLDTHAVRAQGLKAAIKMRLLDARAYACIRNEQLGVWFFRVPPARP